MHFNFLVVAAKNYGERMTAFSKLIRRYNLGIILPAVRVRTFFIL